MISRVLGKNYLFFSRKNILALLHVVTSVPFQIILQITFMNILFVSSVSSSLFYFSKNIPECRQRCSGCGMQSCQKLCYEACEPVCYETIQKNLPCGHKQTTLCYEPVEDTHCDARCNKELVCGHACIKPCSDDCMCDYAVMFKCTTCKKKTFQCSSVKLIPTFHN